MNKLAHALQAPDVHPAPKPACRHRICVLKFGSSVLFSPADYSRAAHEIYRHTRNGEKVVAVVSALDGETDELFGLSDTVGAQHEALTARLVRCGELKSAALMGLALDRAGIPVNVLDPHEMDLTAAGSPLDANLTGLDANRLHDALDTADALVVPGFFAEGENGPVTLGRGGTDLTAVIFSHLLGADRVRLIKDVDGVYTDDPARNPDAERLDRLDYSEALRVSHGLVQEKALIAAEKNDVVVEVAALGKGYATRIGRHEREPGAKRDVKPLRVALLGHGAVGAGVRQLLEAHPGRFALNPILVRDPAAHASAHPDTKAAFTADLAEALGSDPDIVVEVLGGTGLALELLHSALDQDSALVSANKAALARDFEALHAKARKQGKPLLYSASVGGGAPILEAVDRLAQSPGLAMIEGVMNGTSNYLLDRLAEGMPYDEAIAEAQALGFAEADPSADTDGHDAADKLSLLIRHAFDVAVDPASIPKMSIGDIQPHVIAAASAEGARFRQVAHCHLSDDGQVSARVDLVRLPEDHLLAQIRNEENRFRLVDKAGGVHIVNGKGAGRWPTAEAVFADLMDIQRHATGAVALPGLSARMPALDLPDNA